MYNTRIFHTTPLPQEPTGLQQAAQLLHDGELVAIPTETVYGLAANALREESVQRIYEVKGRPSNNPLIVHISDLSELEPLTTSVPASAYRLAERYWPGPLTLVLPKSELISPTISGGLDTVAVRMPAHPIARELIRLSGCPLAAPSANLSGKPSPTTVQHVLEDFDGKIAAIVDGGDCTIGVESTVLSLHTHPPRLLRPGGVTLAQLEEVLSEVEVDRAVLSRLEKGATASSPGMLHKHYAPVTRLVLLQGSSEDFAAFLNSKADKVGALCFDEDIPLLRVPFVSYGTPRCPETLAHRIFDALREIDRLGVETVYAHCPSADGIGLAVYNRLLRAADFQIQKV